MLPNRLKTIRFQAILENTQYHGKHTPGIACKTLGFQTIPALPTKRGIHMFKIA